jgi:hypothetical protein
MDKFFKFCNVISVDFNFFFTLDQYA